MIELNDYLGSEKMSCHADISLSGWLEAIIGNYYLAGEGSSMEDFHWIAVYFDAAIDSSYECVEQIPANLVAYVSSDYRWSFVLNRFIEKFKKDTSDYRMRYILVTDFWKENLKCSCTELLPQEFSNIVWIDDDFMSNENIPFDFDKFSLIDNGVPYLNPKHFSVEQLISVMEG